MARRRTRIRNAGDHATVPATRRNAPPTGAAQAECVGQPFWDSVAGSVSPIQQDSHIGLQASYHALQGEDRREQPIMFALVALAIFLGLFIGLGLSLADFAPEGPELHPPIHSKDC